MGILDFFGKRASTSLEQKEKAFLLIEVLHFFNREIIFPAKRLAALAILNERGDDLTYAGSAFLHIEDSDI